MMSSGETEVVYFVHPAKYVGRKNWYKIGRTTDFYNRLKDYRCGSVVHSVRRVRKSDGVEGLLLKAFNLQFTLVEGRETFQGDIQAMIELFETITRPFNYVEPFVEMTDDEDDEDEDTDSYSSLEAEFLKEYRTLTVEDAKSYLLSLSAKDLTMLAQSTAVDRDKIKCPRCSKQMLRASLRRHLNEPPNRCLRKCNALTEIDQRLSENLVILLNR